MYYHNITKGIYNESDMFDFMAYYAKGDIVKQTEFGDATVEDIPEKDLNDMIHDYNLEFGEDI